MKKYSLTTSLIAVVALLSSCGSQRELTYLQDAPRDEPMEITNNFVSTIKPGDILYIRVDSQSPESVLPFNEETNRLTPTIRGTGKVNAKPHGYTVSGSGKIIFPVLGKIHAAGLSRQQLADTIALKIVEQQHIKDPLVTVELMNFHVTVIGEVKRPSELTAEGGRLTIFEALAMCGDVTMYGIRSCVTVIRNDGYQQTIDTLDLTSKEVLNSPYYYLQQNDIVYVEPTEKRKKQAYRDDDWIVYVSTGTAALRLAYTIVRNYTTLQRYNR